LNGLDGVVSDVGVSGTEVSLSFGGLEYGHYFFVFLVVAVAATATATGTPSVNEASLVLDFLEFVD